ncbi:hypothetical protein HYR99_22940 [Candidatus Poribacteria bacterium]|nr:hypothetical protein [Candidatus Poribacteria bacterium]
MAGEPAPDPVAGDAPHSTIGTVEGRKVGPYKQTHEYKEGGELVKRTDYTEHGCPNEPGHTHPHNHYAIPNPTGGTPRVGPATPHEVTPPNKLKK